MRFSTDNRDSTSGIDIQDSLSKNILSKRQASDRLIRCLGSTGKGNLTKNQPCSSVSVRF